MMHVIDRPVCNTQLVGYRSAKSAETDLVKPNGTETEKENITETNVDVEEYFIPDAESLAKLREKCCIQCLESLGEYVEVLGPVLHEKGVDVCLALLQRNSKTTKPLEVAMLLPDIMKLICALAAHRKFAALFVDRGGMQKLLAVPRVAQTFFGLSSCLFTIGSLQVMAVFVIVNFYNVTFCSRYDNLHSVHLPLSTVCFFFFFRGLWNVYVLCHRMSCPSWLN